jgi:hypothetical protein
VVMNSSILWDISMYSLLAIKCLLLDSCSFIAWHVLCSLRLWEHTPPKRRLISTDTRRYIPEDRTVSLMSICVWLADTFLIISGTVVICFLAHGWKMGGHLMKPTRAGCNVMQWVCVAWQIVGFTAQESAFPNFTHDS